MLTDEACRCGASKRPESKTCRACWRARGPRGEDKAPRHPAPPGEKWCTACENTHPVGAFGKRERTHDGLDTTCREARRRAEREWYARDKPGHVARTQAWNKANPEKAQIVRLRAKAKELGLDPDEVEQAFREHNGLCDICGEPCKTGRRLAIEHCHKTGKFRGFACMDCNVMLGHARDDPGRLMAGAAYVIRHA